MGCATLFSHSTSVHDLLEAFFVVVVVAHPNSCWGSIFSTLCLMQVLYEYIELVNPEQDLFLNYDLNSKLSFEDKSAIYCSLVALVKAGYTFDNALQNKAARFLISLEPKWDPDHPAKLISELVPSTAGSPSGFIDSISTLLSSPHSTLIGATFSFIRSTTLESTPTIRCQLVESDLITNVLAIIQPHTLPISGNDRIFDHIYYLIIVYLNLASPGSLSELGITDAVDAYNHREMIFQKVVLPSSLFVTFLISNRNIVFERFPISFFNLLSIILLICPFHRPTLEFVLASPIVMTFSSCLLLIEDSRHLWNILKFFNISLQLWKADGAEVTQSTQRMIQALFLEGIEDALEQIVKHDIGGNDAIIVDYYCQSISQLLGSNMYEAEDDDEEESEDEVTSLE
ncbi:hypothetical protein BLNAU_4892 [Blattamonas nauphoetae]|uniref:Uncharacterized protein n=1 Tax=Blattamonas nauphoetae TaxID=2049346 RepID=A0ABQ9Y8I0_9EUKA|nr:hypothetical protein BLNAU_4892 [Blattamonas nauphoetae]